MIDKKKFLCSDETDMYKRYGFTILRVYSEKDFHILEDFAKQWIYRLLAKWTASREDSLLLKNYHIWSTTLHVDHANTFSAKNRYLYPEKEIKNILLNEKVETFLKEIGMERNKIWDDGWGWLGFRFIRPGATDGYPLSRKDWGIAKGAVSCWLPIIGFRSSETLNLVPGSHLKEYEKYLPENDKFTKGEYRIKRTKDIEVYNPNLDMGEVIFYHPKTLHSEDVVNSDIARLNLEFRFIPET